jgi:hypothetical protein
MNALLRTALMKSEHLPLGDAAYVRKEKHEFFVFS